MYSPKLNWLRDPVDPRDVPYRAKRPRAGQRPRRVDLRRHCSPVENQGNLGACTGNAVVGAMEWNLNKCGVPFADLSRLMAYYNGRIPIFKTGEDSGAFIRDVIKGLAKYGVCDESLWPYIESKFADRPSAEAYKAAAKRQIISYERLRSLDEILDCLAGPNGDDGAPVVLGFDVPAEFMGADVAATGVAPAIDSSTQFAGGHAVLAVGFDEDAQMLILRNSWGGDWGQAGYFLMPFEYVTSGHTADHWVIYSQENPATVTESTGIWSWFKNLFIVGLLAGSVLASGCTAMRSQSAKAQTVNVVVQTTPAACTSDTNGTQTAVFSDASNGVVRVNGSVTLIIAQNVQQVTGGGTLTSNYFSGTLSVPVTPTAVKPVVLPRVSASGGVTNAAPLRILVVGDSWASAKIAESQRDDGWPEMMGLPADMRQGVAGSTAADWACDKGGMLTRALATPCDRVVVSLGGNDMFHAYADKLISPDEIAAASAALRSVVSKFQDKVGVNHVWVLLYANPYPDRADARFAVFALRTGIILCCPDGTQFLDTEKVLNAPVCWANDDFHPSFEGHVRVSNLVVETVK